MDIIYNIRRSNLIYIEINYQRKVCFINLQLLIFMDLWFSSGVKHASKIRKDANRNTFEESKIPDENLYRYHR